MAYLWMLIGLPGVGKSTWMKQNMTNLSTDIFVASSDSIIETEAQRLGKTYNEVFSSVIDSANRLFFSNLQYAYENEKNVAVDRTNLTVKSRKRVLDIFKHDYIKIAIVFTCAESVQFGRLNQRAGKTISSGILVSMRNSFQMPSLEEGFDQMVNINTNPRFE